MFYVKKIKNKYKYYYILKIRPRRIFNLHINGDVRLIVATGLGIYNNIQSEQHFLLQKKKIKKWWALHIIMF